MRVFLAVLRLAALRELTYRTAVIAGFITNFFFGWIRISVFIALYQGHDSVNGMSLEAAISYVALTQAAISFLAVFGTFDVMQSVYAGEIGGELLRPTPYLSMAIAKQAGKSLSQLALRGIPILLVTTVAFGGVYPTSPGWILSTLTVALLAWCICHLWQLLANLSSFWFSNAIGFVKLAVLVSMFCSGFLMPLRLFPEWVQDLLWYTPFASTLNALTEVYCGLTTGWELVQLVLTQSVWVVVLFFAVIATYKAGLRRLVILGG